ncbi:hypothetical protein [Methylobacterium fujisawaense]|uniref:hypothetical protein n=1 Tax=Methylobacterium fujisawaense TaxID=107400 RepID=UPI00313F2200
MDRSREVEAANVAVHEAISRLIEEGHDPQDLANVLFAYAMSSMVQTHGRKDVARHLYAMSVKFADEHQNPLRGSPSKH